MDPSGLDPRRKVPILGNRIEMAVQIDPRLAGAATGHQRLPDYLDLDGGGETVGDGIPQCNLVPGDRRDVDQPAEIVDQAAWAGPRTAWR
jgi:hypothetical protein